MSERAMSERFLAACVQPTCIDDVEANLARISGLIREARAAGAALIATPEVSNLIAPNRAVALERSEPETQGTLCAYRALAAELGAWLSIGSLSIRLEGHERIVNRSYLIDAGGRVVAHYDKIHMFDVELANGERYRESRTFRPGSRAVLAETPWGMLGVTICYDLRFAGLYRKLAQAGADFLTIPSAFTRQTGKAHWHVLHRARAIETGCFVIAAAQCGEHSSRRQSYGHSLIVDPWGAVLADGGEEPGIVVAEIDPAKVAEARAMVPSLRHDRDFELAAPMAGPGAGPGAGEASAEAAQ